MKAVVFTLGCKVNECESDSLIEGLYERGYEVSDKLEYADLYVVNTCAVTAEAEKKSRQTASRIKKFNPCAKIIFTGCAAEKNPSAFIGKADNCLVTGVFSKSKILEMLDKSGMSVFPAVKDYEELLPVKSLRTRTYIKVQDGCDNFCAYCIIPYLRGRSRSRSPESIANEIEKLSPKEAIINGINLSSYNYNGKTLADLLSALKNVSCRIRLGSLEAGVITPDFLEAAKSLKDFAPHFHLSLQSGSDKVLKKMNRRYLPNEFAKKCDLIRKYFPDAAITTDIIVGFPTETEDDFLATLQFAEAVKFADIHAFIYSPRSGTVAYKLKDLPFEVKKERMERLTVLKGKLKAQFIEKMIGKTLDFLPEERVEEYVSGYSENYVRLYVKNCKEKNICKVKVIEPFLDGALAEAI